MERVADITAWEKHAVYTTREPERLRFKKHSS